MKFFIQQFFFSVFFAFVFTFIIFNSIGYTQHQERFDIDISYVSEQPPEEPVIADEVKAQLCVAIQECYLLAEAGYHEARGESDEGILDVFAVIANRVEHESFPDTFEDVIYQPKQFSYTHDGSLNRGFVETEVYHHILVLAYDFLHDEFVVDNDALFYHNRTVNPTWNRDMRVVKDTGSHIFFTF